MVFTGETLQRSALRLPAEARHHPFLVGVEHAVNANNALTIATKANSLAANPLEGLEPFRVKRKTKVELLTPEEMRAFLSALDPRLGTVLLYLRFYGTAP